MIATAFVGDGGRQAPALRGAEVRPEEQRHFADLLATKDLAEQKLFETRRKGGRALKAYPSYAEVHGRPTTT